MLDPKFIAGQQLILTKNGVILFFGDIPASCLHLQEQLPTLACPVLRPGRGHMLPPSFTGGTWPADVSYGHVRREKGAGFVAGGEIPTNVRTTAWQFMGQDIPKNYGKLVFGYPLTLEADFDPLRESVHGLVAQGSQEREDSAQNDQPRAEGSQEREEPAPNDEPMQNPYQQPSRRAGGSLQREGPVDQWEQQRSSSGSSEPPEEQVEVPPDDQPEQEQTPAHARKDPQEDEPMSEEVGNPREPEDQPDEKDDIVEQVSCSSISASNPWILYEAGIVCSRDEDGHVEMLFR